MTWRPLRTTALLCRRLRRDIGGLVAIEFALVFPVMVIMLMGLYDGSAALIAYRRVTVAAETAAVIATELSLQLSNNSTTCFAAPCTSLTVAQAKQASSAIYGAMPTLYSSGGTFSVTMSAVSFTVAPANCDPSTGATCTYTAQVAWSVPLQYGTATVRPCGILTQVAQTATPTLTTVPTLGMAPLSSVLIVDVSYTFRPLFTQVFTGPVKFSHSAFLPSRIKIGAPVFASAPANTSASSFIQYNVNNTHLTDSHICPGYGCTATAGAGNNVCS